MFPFLPSTVYNWRRVCMYIYVCACVVPALQAKSPEKSVYPADYPQAVHDQISNLNIRAFCQDSLGNMWIATFRGLNRYNGYEFVQYFHDKNDSLSIDDDFIISLFLDSSHRLWVGTATGVNRYDFMTHTFKKYPATREIAYVHSFYEDHTHQLWVATSTGPGQIDTLTCRVNMDANEKQSVHLFMEDNTQKLWMGLNDTLGLACKNENTWEYLPVSGKRSVTCIYCDPQGIWW